MNPAPKMDMSASRSGGLGSGLQWQFPAFVAVGLFGLVVDSTITFTAVRAFDVDPLLARFPAFAVATVLNFWLNRVLTFRGSSAPLAQAFVRYCMVCAFGFCVSFLTYAAALKGALFLGFAVPAAYLPIFVAWGAGCAMFVTFFGFRRFAFKI